MTDDSIWKISDDSDLRKYRTEIPNMADDDLGPFEYRLYAHYKRVCGADGGTCFQSVRTTARETQMSVGQVVNSRRQLKDDGWITVTTHQNGTLAIRIVDRWLENFMRYAPRSSDEQSADSVHGVNAAFTTRTDRSLDEQQRSPGEPKKELIKKQPLKKELVEETTDAAGAGNDSDFNPFVFYQDEKFGKLTQFVSEDLGELLDSYGPDLLREAMATAVRANARNLRYVRATCEGMAKQADIPEDSRRYISDGVDF